ncbi:VCBS repeat-containing protein, partial [bacterium]|nr:VCBS repeat-containing protein [bacterium]
VGMNFVQAKSKPDKPPDKGGKPPKLDCNNNGVCELGEWDSNSDPENQPCADCLPKVYPPLDIDQTGVQIACAGSSYLYSYGKVYQFKYLNDEYQDTWGSDKIGVSWKNVSIGDVDNDGEKEITAIVNYFLREETSGRGRNKVITRYYDQKVFIFESGDGATASEESSYFGGSTDSVTDTIIADVDNDGKNEFILLKGKHFGSKHVEIYEWDGSDFVLDWPVFADYEYNIFTLDVGDADNDRKNELVLAMFDVGAPIIWKLNDSEVWVETIAETIDVINPNAGFLGIDYTMVRDSDNDELNEIVCGGNNYRLMVWEHNPGTGGYDSTFISEDLGGCTEGVDVGDINGDGYNEVVIGASRDTMYVFEYDDVNDTYNIVNSISVGGGFSGLVVGDIDYDGRDEIAAALSGLRIFDFIGNDLNSGYLEETYYGPYGSTLEIK